MKKMNLYLIKLIMGLIVLGNESLLRIMGALWVLYDYSLENLSSFIDIYFLYNSVMDLDAIKQALLKMLKIGKIY